MKTQINPSFNWIPVMLAALAIPAAVAIAFLAMNKPEVAGQIGILPGVFSGIMALGAYTTLTARETVSQAVSQTVGQLATQPGKLSVEAAAAAAITEGIEWVDTVPLVPKTPTRLRVTSVRGGCAHGFLPGNTWVLDSQGNLSRPICAAAAEAFRAMYQSSGKEMPEEISCDCPLSNREVTFEVEAMV